MTRIDLHLHSSASDGHLRPAELVESARQRHLNAIALTDHDTTAGIAEAVTAAQGFPVIIPAIELTATDHNREIHILGYYIQPEHPALQDRLQRRQAERIARARRIVARLSELGAPVEWERVQLLAGSGTVGRPHIARALRQAGHVATVSEAFDRYLGDGRPAHISHPIFLPEEAIALIHQAGGAAALAHPGLAPDYAALIERLVPVGLDGIEAHHPGHGAAVRANLRGMAARFNLVVTGGSDFHRPGDPLGGEHPPPTCLRDLRLRAGRGGG
ncbi:MAG: PHP domain-containing protein [Anaerolineae bacterium]|nr:PHP domain-containing protein [Anaerolineae bacterium]